MKRGEIYRVHKPGSDPFTLSLHRAARHFTRRYEERCSYNYIALY
jgi:hypothetical protein